MTPDKKPVESHSNNFFPVGSLYCISLLELGQVKELELKKGHFGMLPSMKRDHFKIVEELLSNTCSTPFLSPGSLAIFMLTCRITLSERGILNLKFRNESRRACQ